MRRITVLFMLLAATAGATAQTVPQTGTEAQRANRAEGLRMRAEREALRALFIGTITLPEALRRAGGRLTVDARPNIDALEEGDVTSLAKHSRVVLRGQPLGPPRVQLSEDQRTIVTRYTFQVDEILRGGPGGRDMPALMVSVTVDIPGGTLTLPEGTVEVVNDAAALDTGASYVLFLQREVDAPAFIDNAAPPRHKAGGARGDDPFMIVGAHREGLFLVDNGRVQSLASSSSPGVKERYNGRALESFVNEVRGMR